MKTREIRVVRLFWHIHAAQTHKPPTGQRLYRMTQLHDPDSALAEHLALVQSIASRFAARTGQDADLVSSDALLHALTLARSHDPARSTLAARLLHCLPLRLLDDFRQSTGHRRKSRKGTVGLDFDPPAELDCDLLDANEQIECLIRPLDPCRRAVMRAWAYGQSQASIARQRGLHPSRVSQFLKQCLAELKEAHHAR